MSSLRFVLFLGVAGVLSSVCRAQLVGTSFNNGDGTFTYNYSILNTAGVFDIVAFSLDFSFPSASIDWNQFGGVTVPVGWDAAAGIPTKGASAQDFFSIMPSADVKIGSVLAGFSFISSFEPGLIDYIEFGAAGEILTGRTIGAALSSTPVPEPATWIATPIFLAVIFSRLRRRFSQGIFSLLRRGPRPELFLWC